MDIRGQLQVLVTALLLNLNQLFQLRNAASKPPHEVNLPR